VLWLNEEAPKRLRKRRELKTRHLPGAYQFSTLPEGDDSMPVPLRAGTSASLIEVSMDRYLLRPHCRTCSCIISQAVSGWSQTGHVTISSMTWAPSSGEPLVPRPGSSACRAVARPRLAPTSLRAVANARRAVQQPPSPASTARVHPWGHRNLPHRGPQSPAVGHNHVGRGGKPYAGTL